MSGMPRRTAAAEALAGARAMSWLRNLPTWRGVVVLGYHRVAAGRVDTPFEPALFSTTAVGLDEQMRFATRHFDVVAPEEIGLAPDARGRRVAITFDDGYRDNYELALPVLRKHGVRAAFFLPTGFLDEPRVPWWDELAWIARRSAQTAIPAGDWLEAPLPLERDRSRAVFELANVYKSLPSARTEAFMDYCGEAAGTGRCDPATAAEEWMTWAMAAEMRDAGMTIGGHSVTHPVLANADPETQRREIEGCARRLDEELGVPMRLFAYPVGLRDSFDEATRRALAEAGVELAFSLYGGYVRPGRIDPYDVPRTSVGPATTPRAFRAMLTFPQAFARW
jgi:peptidoglycan/xylan/chitin deacetylase (PgdA/CDA1 family)